VLKGNAFLHQVNFFRSPQLCERRITTN